MSDCLAALWDWEDPLYINWGCSFCEDVGVDLQQQWEQCPDTVPINRVETAWFCLLCSFWLMSSRFSLMPATLSFGQALWCEVCVVTGDAIHQCGTRGRMKPLGSDTVGKHERERERERLWRGRMTESAAVWESHGDFSQSAEQERVRLLGKCWDFFCMCVWDANRSLPTEGEAWDVGKMALTDRTGWWAHLSYIFQSHQT